MNTFIRVLSSERLKMSKSNLWLLTLGSPLLALLVGLLTNSAKDASGYMVLMSTMSLFHALLFLPILTGIFSSFICRYEHVGGGWKSLLSLPVSRTSVFTAKFLIVAALLALTQLLFLGSFLIASQVKGIHEPFPWAMLTRSIIGGWVACLPLAALQLGFSLRWASFAAPLVVNVIFTVPNILVINSDKIRPFYPWAQPIQAMIPASSTNIGSFGFNLSFESLMITVVGSFVLFFAAGLIYFNRREI
ncbi:ABC transporter permease [Paenibacillus tuaregi]|uniref:ABC transporter permease n=1 Tax=Paenibacillus tuaregi TaxID=1816681 RepID=UPI0009ED5DBA|nr:ABC transporter permease [Paenibacillus tuaregi]